jgi:hypothetical protein
MSHVKGRARYRSYMLNSDLRALLHARDKQQTTQLVPGGEDYSKPRLPAHHPLVSLGYALQREDFIH